MANQWIVFTLSFFAIFVMVIANEQVPDSGETMDRKSEEIANDKRGSFFVGSRYGRSYYGNAKSTRVNVSPRNDRFFLGSRYGKRNSNEYSPLDLEQQGSSTVVSSLASNHGKFFSMSCVHTGFKNYFRCNSVNDIDNYIQHLTNDEQ